MSQGDWRTCREMIGKGAISQKGRFLIWPLWLLMCPVQCPQKLLCWIELSSRQPWCNYWFGLTNFEFGNGWNFLNCCFHTYNGNDGVGSSLGNDMLIRFVRGVGLVKFYLIWPRYTPFFFLIIINQEYFLIFLKTHFDSDFFKTIFYFF